MNTNKYEKPLAEVIYFDLYKVRMGVAQDSKTHTVTEPVTQSTNAKHYDFGDSAKKGAL